MTDAEQPSGITLLVTWANSRDHWVRPLVAAVLDVRRDLSEDLIKQFYGILLREKELADAEGEPVSVPPIEHDGKSGDPEKALRLTKLSNVRNVNALAANQEISFHPRMTVLYGENGAGKTGYVRVLKKLASVRTVEAILPNITRPDADGAPSALIAYEIGDIPDSFPWAGEEGISPFTQIDVFDAPSVDLHVDGDLTYIYTPSDLAVFRYTNDAIETVKTMLTKAREDALPTGNPYLNKFSREGTLYAKIETLGSTTDLSELEAFANITKEEREQLDPLQERVNALRSGTSAAKLQVAETERDLFTRVKDAVTTAKAFDLDAYAHALEALRSAEQAHTHATQEALVDETIPGVLEETWRHFIEAGELYVSEQKSDGYPKHGDTCPYCLQDLGTAAIAVLQKYRAFCRSDLQDAIKSARTALDNLIHDVHELDLDRPGQDIQNRLDATKEGETPDERLVAAHAFITELRTLQKAVDKGEDLQTSKFKTTLREARPLVDTRLTNLEKLIEGLRTEVGEQRGLLAKEAAKLRALQDRITLSELFPAIRDHVEKAKWASRAKIILGRFPALSRSLTEASKLASEQLLNRDFEATFFDECKALRAPPVTLEFPGRKGQPARRKSLTPQHRLSAILSEGEQKVIALADFIAEATLRRTPTPLVLDDPITSLDYKRILYVVARLVELSETRQIIVFTHNIWFTMELLARFDTDRKACTYYDVSEKGLERGIVSAGESPKLDTWGDKKKRINLLIEHIKGEDKKEMRDVLIEKGYEDLRGACEIVVEQDLLQSVVQSYRPNVMVGKLLRLKFDKLAEASSTVNEIFDRCCRFIGSHKQPLETLNVRPTLEQLTEDWQALQSVHSEFSN